MHKIILIVINLFASCVFLFGCADASNERDFLHAQGQELHINNQPTRLRAVCFSNYYNKRDINPLHSNHHAKKDYQNVKDMGFNTIRFAFNGNWYENDRDSFWQWLDQNINWAREHNILLILDLHVPIESFWLAPESPEASFAIWSDKDIQRRNIELWRAIAKRYKNEPVIAGYDILNEPVTTDSTGEQWQQLARQMVSAIREIDQNHLIIVEKLYGVNQEYSNTDAQQQFLVDDDNILYDFHFYEPIDYTHQYAAWVANPLGDGGKYPDSKHLTPTGEQVLKPETRIITPSLNKAHKDWREYKSKKVVLKDTDTIAAIPILTIRNGGSGSVYFDDIRVFEYDADGNFLGEALHDPLSKISVWKWWHWQLGDANINHASFKRETETGKNDKHSLSITLNEFNQNATTGWSSDYNWVKVTPGHSYQLSVYMRTASDTGSFPQATLELDFYRNPDNGNSALLGRDATYLEHQFLKYYQFGKDNNVPISVLETGLVRHAFEKPEKGGPNWVRDLLTLFDKYQTSYAWWNYHGDQMGIFLSDQDSPPAQPNQPLIDTLIEMQKGKHSTLAIPEKKISVSPSSSPPGGLIPQQVPQFVVIGFDDNTIGAGLDWAADLFQTRENPDGSPARVSFYMNSHGFNEWQDDDPKILLSSLKRLAAQGHEIGNHTHNHHRDLTVGSWSRFENIIKDLDQNEWNTRIQQCTDSLHKLVGLPKHTISGFRAPFLKYNQPMLTTLLQQGFTYDTSIEEGYSSEFDGRNFRWPYTLDYGSPGHDESWLHAPENPNRVELGSTPELWELPNHVLIVPDDNKAAKYGIATGLWERMQRADPRLNNRRITGFDYNLLVNAKLRGNEMAGILKYNLDLRLEGNRAPMMFGAHTQYYVSEKWVAKNAPQTTTSDMQQAIREFVDYALSKPEVRIRPAREIIEWCKNPQPIAG